VVDIYVKVLFLLQQSIVVGSVRPTSADFLIKSLRDKGALETTDISYALNLRVPTQWEEEMTAVPKTFLNRMKYWFETSMYLLPETLHTQTFRADEDPVRYVMTRLGNIFPEVYQSWDDKLSDAALTRFCRVGLAAHRVESVLEGGASVADGATVKFFVVRTNALSSLTVKGAYARYAFSFCQ
jgi:hypothetical protein